MVKNNITFEKFNISYQTMKKQEVYDKILIVFLYILRAVIIGIPAFIIIFVIYVCLNLFLFQTLCVLGAIIFLVIVYKFCGEKVRELMEGLGSGIMTVMVVILGCCIIISSLISLVENISEVLRVIGAIVVSVALIWLVIKIIEANSK